MSTPFLSEIRLISWNYAPKGWAFCNGQTLPINQNQALFALLGTTYGGNGVTTFKLPDLQNRTPMHFSGTFPLGAVGGETTHTLGINELAQHAHTPTAINAAPTSNSPTGATLSQPSSIIGNLYGTSASLTSMAPQSVTNAGGSQPHNNLQPYLVMNFIIALQGIFPSRN